MVGLSVGEKHFIHGGIAQDVRSDDQEWLTYRPIFVETGVIPQANGSARFRIGTTDVIPSVKAGLGEPGSLQPDKGRVNVYVDCSPIAAPMFEGRGGEELSTELSMALQRCLLGGRSGADGNLLDALGAAIKVGKHYIVDATSEEESEMSFDVSISVIKKGHIRGLTKRGGVLDPSIILDM